MEFEDNDFSWTGLFIVTACCCVFFNGLLKLVEGNFSTLLFIVAGIAAILGISSWVRNSLDPGKK